MPKIPVLDDATDSKNGPSSPSNNFANDEAAENQLRQQPPSDPGQSSQQSTNEPQEQTENRQDSQEEPDNQKKEDQAEDRKENPEGEDANKAKEASEDAKGLKDKFGGKEAAEASTPGEIGVGSGGIAGESATAGTGGATAATGAAGATSVTAGGGAVAAGSATASSGVVIAGTGAAAGSSPIWGPIAIGAGIVIVTVVLVVIFLAALCGPLGICGTNTGTAEAAEDGIPGDGGEPGSGGGLIDDFCQGLATPCSLEFKKIIEAAASWAQLPAAVLVTVGLREYSGTYSLNDAEILAASAPSAQLIPCPVNPVPVITGEHATGPMQFIPSTWAGYGNAATEAGVRPAGYTGEICNVLDSYYAGAKYLKTLLGDLTGEPFSTPLRAWSRDDLRYVVFRYGSCTVGDEACVDALYSRYIDKSLTGVGDGSVPSGWPTTGSNNQTPFCMIEFTLGVACTSHSALAAVDIGSAGPVYATQDGIMTVLDTGEPTGDILTSPCAYSPDSSPYGCLGLHVIIRGADYITIYAHLDRTNISPCLSHDGEMVKMGTYLGISDSTGRSTGPHVHYEVRDLSGAPITSTTEELDKVFPADWRDLHSGLTTFGSGTNCFL